MATIEVDADYLLTAGTTIEVDADFTLLPPGLTTIEVTADYSLTNPGGATGTIEVTADYQLTGLPRLMVRQGLALVPARLGMRQGGAVVWLSPPL